MKIYEIDGRSIKNADDFYNEFQKIEEVPNYFGKNLDALWDVLSSSFENPSTFILNGVQDHEALISLAPIIRTFTDAEVNGVYLKLR